RDEDLGRLLGHLAADPVDPAGEQFGCVRVRWPRSSAILDRSPELFEPGEALGLLPGPARVLEPEATPRSPMAGGSGRIDRQQQCVAVTVQCHGSQSQDIAARLAFAPQAAARSRVEMDLAGV